MFASGGKIRFLSETKSYLFLKDLTKGHFQMGTIPWVQFRGYKNHKEDPLYVPFATDAERELASIRFWVSKNTNLKEVNVNCRVGCCILILTDREPIYPSGAFLLIVKFIFQEGVQFRPIRIKIL